jgi:hypothetical protein
VGKHAPVVLHVAAQLVNLRVERAAVLQCRPARNTDPAGAVDKE